MFSSDAVDQSSCTIEFRAEAVKASSSTGTVSVNSANVAVTAKESFISIKVYDFLGREVKTLVNEFKATGSYDLVFDASNLPSGTYFYTMMTNNFSDTKKMIILK